MPLQPKLNKFSTASPMIASFDYYDFAEGTGVKVFYGCGTTDSVGEGTILTATSLYADPLFTTSDDFNQAAFALEKTINFDLQVFNITKIIKSIAFIDGSMSCASNAGTVAGSMYIVWTFQHFDGDSTYTDFGTVTSETISSSSDSTTIQSFCLDCALTETVFAKGHALRVRAQIYGRDDDPAGGGSRGRLCHDPKNRDADPFTAATNHTSLNFHVPFDLQQ